MHVCRQTGLHHVRVALECLKELGAQDLPARVLLTRKVRCTLCCSLLVASRWWWLL
jgi:hypothetical protein